MSTDSEKSWLDEETETEVTESPSIEELMADGDGADVVDLDQSAIHAAENLLGDDGPGGEPGSQGLWDTDYDEEVDYGEEQPQARNDSWLHGLMVLNIVLLGVMLALPGKRPATPETERAGYTPSTEGVAMPVSMASIRLSRCSRVLTSPLLCSVPSPPINTANGSLLTSKLMPSFSEST